MILISLSTRTQNFWRSSAPEFSASSVERGREYRFSDLVSRGEGVESEERMMDREARRSRRCVALDWYYMSGANSRATIMTTKQVELGSGGDTLIHLKLHWLSILHLSYKAAQSIPDSVPLEAETAEPRFRRLNYSEQQPSYIDEINRLA